MIVGSCELNNAVVGDERPPEAFAGIKYQALVPRYGFNYNAELGVIELFQNWREPSKLW